MAHQPNRQLAVMPMDSPVTPELWISAKPTKCCQTAPSARCGPHVPDVKECGDEMAHRLTKAAEAMAAIPSSRPVKPSVSDVVALIDT